MIEAHATVAAGTCRHVERLVYRGGGLRAVVMPSLVGVMVHRQHGVVLFDTGFAPRLAELPGLEGALYRRVVPTEVGPNDTAAARVSALGLAPSDVRHVVISHFHPDHIGGLRDFPRARIHASRQAWADVEGSTGLRALRRAWFPGLLPDDFAQRLEPVQGPGDLFGDGSLTLVDLPGHAAGQLGLLVEAEQRTLYVADACWLSQSLDSGRPASKLTRLLVHDSVAASNTLRRLVDWHAREPELHIVPSHCPSVPTHDALQRRPASRRAADA